MLLTITSHGHQASDLGFILHKHPDKFQSFELSIGLVHVFYPESSPLKTTVALLLELDTIEMVRKTKSPNSNFALGHYVNDRPFIASSFMSHAIAKVFSSAMNGSCKNKPELVDQIIPLEITIDVVAAPKGGEMVIRQLFEPLGYNVSLTRHILDTKFTHWGYSKYYSVKLEHTITVQSLLNHLYVLLPALDYEKHYYINHDEVDKLLSKGKGWLEKHPAKELITKRYLINLKSLSNAALTLLADDIVPEKDEDEVDKSLEKRKSLHLKRLEAVKEQLLKCKATTIIDLGCGEGKLIKMLLKERQFTKISGMDVSYSGLTKTKNSLHYDEMPPKQKERLSLFQGSLLYKDSRLEGYEAATLVEVIEHLDENRLPAFERVVFEFATPKTVIITTPNAEYNIKFENLNNEMRHDDHRFEWTRSQFENWAKTTAATYNYKVTILPIGEEDILVGAPTQMGIFTYGN